MKPNGLDIAEILEVEKCYFFGLHNRKADGKMSGNCQKKDHDVTIDYIQNSEGLKLKVSDFEWKAN